MAAVIRPAEPAVSASRVALVAASALAFAFALVLLPSPRRDLAEIAVAAGLAVAVIGLAALWRLAPAVSRLGVPLLFVVVIALLVDSVGGTSSGLGGLFL